MRGGEKVLEILCERFPDAEIFTLVHVRGSVSRTIERLPIHTSFIQQLPFIRRHYRRYLPLFPIAIEQFNLARFDLVVSSSHCVAKSVLTAAGTTHVCYCHTPMRYAWDQFEMYFGAARIGWLGNRAMRPVMAGFARWDRSTSGRVDRFVTNSRHVAARIRRYYNREASVVYPPVDTAFFRPNGSQPEQYALIVSALVPYKHIELALDACRRVGLPLKIVGDGPDRQALERRPNGDVQFLGRVSDEDLRELYCRAAVVLLPGEEDFGIVPLEAQACGRPVVALGRGGALETVVQGETGILVNEPTTDAFGASILEAVNRRFDTNVIRRHAERFGRDRFGDEIEATVREPWPAERAS